MTKQGQTSGMGVAEHLEQVTKYIGRAPDVLLVNVTRLPSELLSTYAADQEFPVVFNYEGHTTRVIPADLLASETIATKAGDTLKRSLIRHDSDKIAQKLIGLL
jgi:hypothetical protein